MLWVLVTLPIAWHYWGLVGVIWAVAFSETPVLAILYWTLWRAGAGARAPRIRALGDGRSRLRRGLAFVVSLAFEFFSMSDGKRRPQCVAIVTPAWPPGLAPNGIVTYTSHLVSAFETKGVRSVLLSWHVPGVAESDPAIGRQTDVIDIGRFGQRAGILGKVAAKARRLLKGPVAGDARLRMIARAVESALARFPIEVVEMEEAFGLAAAVVELKRVPVVIRLHGPWFINGEVLGEKKDVAFHNRVEEEGRAIAAADAVTAPSQDILDRTRAYYGLPLSGAA